MRVYRLSKTQYARDLEGTGAKLFGGRWNHVDTPCVYTSESRALAILEYSVNSNVNFIPRALSICVFEIDDSLVYELKIKKLPGDWKEVPAPYSTKDLGTKQFQKGKAILKIPSIVIPDEFNYLLNPEMDEKAYKLIEVKDFIYDLRIKIDND